MRRGLLAVALTFVPCSGCDYGPGSLPTASGSSYGWGGLSGAELAPQGVRLRVGESSHFTARLSNERFTRLTWLLGSGDTAGDAEFWGSLVFLRRPAPSNGSGVLVTAAGRPSFVSTGRRR
jgi:hypothetical protein